MEDNKNTRGGILADDMGLGKTISSLALILARPSADQRCKVRTISLKSDLKFSNSSQTTLIVGPVALVRQWEREFQKKIKTSKRLSVLMAHGTKKQKLTWDVVRNYDVVLTTYGTLGAELKKREKWEEDQKRKGHFLANEMDIPPAYFFPFLGAKSMFYRVILDEAQCIKGKNTLAARGACQLEAKLRWCLSGTPIMNSVGTWKNTQK
jgi:SNF2 family DNA or RNA helicase